MDSKLHQAALEMSWPNFLLWCVKHTIDPEAAYIAWSSERSRDPEKLTLLRRAFAKGGL